MCVLVHGYMYRIYVYLQDSCWCRSWWAVESRRVYSSNAPGGNGQDWAAFTSDSTSWPCATFTEVRHTQTRPRWNEQVMKETVLNYVSVCLFFRTAKSCDLLNGPVPLINTELIEPENPQKSKSYGICHILYILHMILYIIVINRLWGFNILLIYSI